jgi:hypothetical protein
MATTHERNSTITITNLLSQTPPHFIDTDMEIYMLALTGNILLALDFATIVAWRLTEEGAVDGVFSDGRAGHSNSIWTVPVSCTLEFSVKDKTVIIKEKGEIIHIYHTETGEVLNPAQLHLPHSWYRLQDVLCGRHYLHYQKLNGYSACSEGGWPVSPTTFQEGWVKDPKGKHQLWIPVEWRMSWVNAGWVSNITTLWFSYQGRIIIIRF